MTDLSEFEEDLFYRCFEVWKDESQMIMLIEECGEVIQSVTKDLMRHSDRPLKERLNHFAEELADLRLMIDEFEWRYQLQEDINYWRLEKEVRLDKRLGKEEQKIRDETQEMDKDSAKLRSELKSFLD